jgi:WD40 repeat protein
MWAESASANYTSVSWAPDGLHLAVSERAGSGGRVFVLALESWNQATIDDFAGQSYSAQAAWETAHAAETVVTPLWEDSGRSFWSTRFSSDGTQVAAAAADGSLTVYDASTGTVVYGVQAPGNGSLTAMDWSPDGKFIAAGGDGKQVFIFDATTGDVIDTLTGHTAELTAIAWSSDACSLATTAGGPRICGMDCHRCTGDPNQTPTCPEYADITARFWTFARP